jgi:choline-glycine betaine transporter
MSDVDPRDESPSWLGILWGATMMVIVGLGVLFYLHAALTGETWKEIVIAAAPAMAPLVLVLLGLTMALRRRWRRRFKQSGR